MTSAYRYGAIYWNEKTGEEIFAYVKSENYCDAEELFSRYELPEFVRGSVHFIEPQDSALYDTPVGKLAERMSNG